MRRTLALTAALFAAMACGDVTGPLGPLDFGIIQGREQAAVAGDAQLDTAVVAKVWRDASGQAFIGAAPLYAQTTVTGVVGAVVCVGEVPIEGEPIIPHSRCTATLSDGTAVFHLTPPTTAGTHRTPIVAEVDGVALTPDTVTAVVGPGAAAQGYFDGGATVTAGSTSDGLIRMCENGYFQDAFGNPVAFRVEGTDWASDTTYTEPNGSRTCPALALARTDVVQGDTTTLRFFVSDSVLVADVRAELVRWDGTDWIVGMRARSLGY